MGLVTVFITGAIPSATGSLPRGSMGLPIIVVTLEFIVPTALITRNLTFHYEDKEQGKITSSCCLLHAVKLGNPRMKNTVRKVKEDLWEYFSYIQIE